MSSLLKESLLHSGNEKKAKITASGIRRATDVNFNTHIYKIKLESIDKFQR